MDTKLPPQADAQAARHDCNCEAREDESELELIMADVAEALGEADGDLEDDGGDADEIYVPGNEHERLIHVRFPATASIIHDVSWIAISKRDFLTWFAERNPERAAQILSLRNDFYGGDHELDYGYEVERSHWLVSPEERARVTVAHQQGREKREMEAARSEAEFHQEQEEERTKWLPFLAEKEALWAEREACWDRSKDLDREWRKFVSEHEDPEEGLDPDAATWKARLRTATDKLIRDQDYCETRWSELKFKVMHGEGGLQKA